MTFNYNGTLNVTVSQVLLLSRKDSGFATSSTSKQQVRSSLKVSSRPFKTKAKVFSDIWMSVPVGGTLMFPHLAIGAEGLQVELS